MAIEGLGTRLRHARRVRGNQSQGAVAKAAGVKQPSISDIESGETKDLSGSTLVAICSFLKIRPEWLITGKEPMDADELGALAPDERELLERYRAAAPRWRVSIRYMAALRGDAQQDEAAESMNVVLAKISAEPASDERVASTYGRPGQPPPAVHQDRGQYQKAPKRRKA